MRKVTSDGFELVGSGTGDENERPGYFEPVRERRWFGGEWVLVQPVPRCRRDASKTTCGDGSRQWRGPGSRCRQILGAALRVAIDNCTSRQSVGVRRRQATAPLSHCSPSKT